MYVCMYTVFGYVCKYPPSRPPNPRHHHHHLIWCCSVYIYIYIYIYILVQLGWRRCGATCGGSASTPAAPSSPSPRRERRTHERDGPVPAMANSVPAMANSVPAMENSVPAMENSVPAMANSVPAMANSVPAMAAHERDDPLAERLCASDGKATPCLASSSPAMAGRMGATALCAAAPTAVARSDGRRRRPPARALRRPAQTMAFALHKPSDHRAITSEGEGPLT